MKTFNYISLIIVSFLFLLSSCCTKEFQICEGLDAVKNISFTNFNQSELDSVYLVSYVSNSNFQTKIDSVRIDSIIASSTANNYQGILRSNMISSNDYILYIKDLNKSYQVSNFIITQETCNRCGEKSYKYNFLKSVEVNSTLQIDLGNPPQIFIHK